MLNLDTHIVVKLIQGGLTEREYGLVVKSPLSISAIVIWEIAKLHQLGRISLAVEDIAFRRFTERARVWPIDIAVASASTRLDFRSDPADEIIAATSLVHGIGLLTRDERILTSKLVPLVSV
jgi:PIN domain nuclease of toxin-antitoxin system